MERFGVAEDDLRRAGGDRGRAAAGGVRGGARRGLPARGRAAAPLRPAAGGAGPAHVQRRRAGPVRRHRAPGPRHAAPPPRPGARWAGRGSPRPRRGGRCGRAGDARRGLRRLPRRSPARRRATSTTGSSSCPPSAAPASTPPTRSAAAPTTASTSDGSAASRLAAVADRRAELDACYAGEPPADDPVLVALADTVRRFGVPRDHLDALLDGVAMDLTVDRYPDFAALQGATATASPARSGW